MKVLVTGSQGQLARSLVERGSGRAGIDILAVGRPELDMEEPGSAERAIAVAAPDVVINAAAFTAVDLAEDEPDRAFRVNAAAAGEVASAAARIGAPIIHISTDYVFDGGGTEAYSEEAPTNPLGVYGRSKLEGEEQVRAANARSTIVRTAWVYSPFGRNFVKTMLAASQTRDVLSVVDDQRGNPSSALDLAEGLLSILDAWQATPGRGLGETYHLAGTGTTTWCGFARQVMAECRKKGLRAVQVEAISTADWPTRAERPKNSALSSAKFARDFGYAMPDWEQSLADVVRRLAVPQ
jgi:dTDP-4-dehydrorhamnose reductase